MKNFITITLLSFTVLAAQPPRSQNKDLKFVFEPEAVPLNIGETKK